MPERKPFVPRPGAPRRPAPRRAALLGACLLATPSPALAQAITGLSVSPQAAHTGETVTATVAGTGTCQVTVSFAAGISSSVTGGFPMSFQQTYADPGAYEITASSGPASPSDCGAAPSVHLEVIAPGDRVAELCEITDCEALVGLVAKKGGKKEPLSQALQGGQVQADQGFVSTLWIPEVQVTKHLGDLANWTDQATIDTKAPMNLRWINKKPGTQTARWEIFETGVKGFSVKGSKPVSTGISTAKASGPAGSAAQNKAHGFTVDLAAFDWLPPPAEEPRTYKLRVVYEGETGPEATSEPVTILYKKYLPLPTLENLMSIAAKLWPAPSGAMMPTHGATVYFSGKDFGGKPGSLSMTFADERQVVLSVLSWDDDGEKASGKIPWDVGPVPFHGKVDVAFHLVRHDGQKSNAFAQKFEAYGDMKYPKLDFVGNPVAVEVCSNGANVNNCNPDHAVRKDSSSSCVGGIPSGNVAKANQQMEAKLVGATGLSFWGRHSNCDTDVNRDKGVDRFSLDVNDWDFVSSKGQGWACHFSHVEAGTGQSHPDDVVVVGQPKEVGDKRYVLDVRWEVSPSDTIEYGGRLWLKCANDPP